MRDFNGNNPQGSVFIMNKDAGSTVQTEELTPSENESAAMLVRVDGTVVV